MIELEINLKFSARTSLEILCLKGGKTVATFRFVCDGDLRDRPQVLEAVKGALTTWAVIDLLRSPVIKIAYGLAPGTQKYIHEILDHSLATYQIGVAFKSPDLIFLETTAPSWEPLILDPDGHGLYRSDGRDSFVCDQILRRMGLSYQGFTVSFDAESTEGTTIFGHVLDEEIYAEVSPRRLRIPGIPTVEEADIHLTFLSALVDPLNHRGTYYAGLPYEFQELIENRPVQGVPTESFLAIRILEEYLAALSIRNFRLLSPLACLTSLGVHGLLLTAFGSEVFDRFVSCPEVDINPRVSPCGSCNKCRKVALIKSMISGATIVEAELLDLYSELRRLFPLTSLLRLHQTLVLRKSHHPFHYAVADCIQKHFGEWTIESQELQP